MNAPLKDSSKEFVLHIYNYIPSRFSAMLPHLNMSLLCTLAYKIHIFMHQMLIDKHFVIRKQNFIPCLFNMVKCQMVYRGYSYFGGGILNFMKITGHIKTCYSSTL